MPTLCNSSSNVSTLRKITGRAKLDSRALALFQFLDELVNDLEAVADDAEVGVLKDRRFGKY